ncbi:amino acid transporter AVT1I-like [Aristolochia californica]|uniref:amino acid transporter AVT1I-like n=1 Tax=Aristolochia californica TaxID=171875 RepID=UPI0035E2D916
MALESAPVLLSKAEADGDEFGLNLPFLSWPDRREENVRHNPQGGTSFLKTCFNVVNALSGIGILSMPHALSEGGWMSLILLLAVAIICCYTAVLLQKCMAANPLAKTYPDIGEVAFGYKGRVIVSTLMYLELYLVAVEFLILEGDNFEKLFPNIGFEAFGIRIDGKQEYILLAALVILPTTWLRSLDLLSFLSVGGVMVSVVLVGSVLWAGAMDGVGFHERGKIFDLKGIPTVFSLYAFCFCGHPVFPSIYASTKDGKRFPTVLIMCFILCTLAYGSMGVLGYLMYGQDVKPEVTLNLPIGKINSKLAIYTTLINPFTKYALMITPIATAIEDISPIFNMKGANIVFIRTLLVVSTVIVALTIPFFGNVMALTGSFLSSSASMLLPCICYLKICPVSRSSRLELMIIGGILAIGSSFAMLGTVSSLRGIINQM